MIISLGWEQENLLNICNDKGYSIIATYNKIKPDLQNYPKIFEQCDPRNLSKIIKIAKKYKVKHFISDQCDYSNYAVGFLRNYFKTHNETFDQYQLTNNKYWMRSKCKEGNIMQPRFFHCKTIQDVHEAMNFINFPIVLKPVDNRGSTGINIINKTSELQNAFLEALLASNSRSVLVEAYIQGIHVSLDGYFDSNKQFYVSGIGSKKIKAGQRPIIYEVNYPANIAQEYQENLLLENSRVIKVLNINRGLIHAEYIIDKNGRPFLLEIANRGGGVHTSSKIIPNYSGINNHEILFKESIGQKIIKKIPKYKKNNFITLRFLIFKEGKIKNIKINEKIIQINNVLSLKLFVKKGSTIINPKNGSERHGFMIVKSNKKIQDNKIESMIKNIVQIAYEK